MYLDELTIGVVAALLVERRLRRSGADHRIRRLAEDGANAAGGYDQRVGREGADLHRAQIHGADSATGTLAVEHRTQKFPALILGDAAFRLIAPHLFVERVEKLLSGR